MNNFHKGDSVSFGENIQGKIIELSNNHVVVLPCNSPWVWMTWELAERWQLMKIPKEDRKMTRDEVERVRRYVELAREAIQDEDPEKDQRADEMFKELSEEEKSSAQGWLFALISKGKLRRA